MDERDLEKEALPEELPAIMIMERRTQRQLQLSSADVMKILRKRAAKAALRRGNGGSGDPTEAG